LGKPIHAQAVPATGVGANLSRAIVKKDGTYHEGVSPKRTTLGGGRISDGLGSAEGVTKETRFENKTKKTRKRTAPRLWLTPRGGLL